MQGLLLRSPAWAPQRVQLGTDWRELEGRLGGRGQGLPEDAGLGALVRDPGPSLVRACWKAHTGTAAPRAGENGQKLSRLSPWSRDVNEREQSEQRPRAREEPGCRAVAEAEAGPGRAGLGQK